MAVELMTRSWRVGPEVVTNGSISSHAPNRALWLTERRREEAKMSKQIFWKAQRERMELKTLHKYRRSLPDDQRTRISVEYRMRSPVHFAILLVGVLGLIGVFLAHRLDWVEGRELPLWVDGWTFLLGAAACKLLFDARRSVGLSRNAGYALSIGLALALGFVLFAL